MLSGKSSLFQDVKQCSPLIAKYVSGEHVASIFRIEEYAKQETSATFSSTLMMEE
jgi:hypothetical protein